MLEIIVENCFLGAVICWSVLGVGSGDHLHNSGCSWAAVMCPERCSSTERPSATVRPKKPQIWANTQELTTMLLLSKASTAGGLMDHTWIRFVSQVSSSYCSFSKTCRVKRCRDN